MTLILPTPQPSFSINILLFEAFSNMLLACLLEPLRVVRDDTGAAVQWTILTHGDAALKSSSGLTITPDLPQANSRSCDILILIGGDQFRADACDPTLGHSLNLTRRAGCIIAADTGPWVLAAAGQLTGRRATLHWQLLSEFAETFPDVITTADRYVRDGRYVTCGSASTALDVILEEIAARFGPAARFDAAAMFLNDPARSEANRAPLGGTLAHGNPVLRKIVSLMAANVEQPLPLDRIAAETGTTLRTMARLFEVELGLSPGRYYQSLRLARARDLALHTNLPLGQIALRCGFSCASALSRAFATLYGHRPRSQAVGGVKSL
jgi:AraC family transcriptional regulator, glycine betaine-responsive activator